MATLSTHFDDALVFAATVHRQQTRRGSTAPYLTHLLAVAALVGQYSGDEEQMIAALLHDAIEDQGVTRHEIARRFGERVASIVEACTDSTTTPKPPWRQRKERLLAQLKASGSDVRLVAVADKLDNARSILQDLRLIGSDIWKRFTATPDDVVWYFRAAIETLQHDWCHPLIEELERTVTEIERLKGASHVG